MSFVSTVNENGSKIHKLIEAVDTGNALNETNLTAMIEAQNLLNEHSNHINECESQLQTKKMPSTNKTSMPPNNTDSPNVAKMNDEIKKTEREFDKLFEIMNDFGVALIRHNNTIKTHFDLNAAYNEEITIKIKSKLDDITLSKQSRNKNVRKEQNVTPNDATMVIKSMDRNKQQSNRIKIFLHNIKTFKSIGELQNELGVTFKQCSDKIHSIKWFTNKIKFDHDNQHITSATIIAILPEDINVPELTKHVNNFLWTSTG